MCPQTITHFTPSVNLPMSFDPRVWETRVTAPYHFVEFRNLDQLTEDEADSFFIAYMDREADQGFLDWLWANGYRLEISLHERMCWVITTDPRTGAEHSRHHGHALDNLYCLYTLNRKEAAA